MGRRTLARCICSAQFNMSELEDQIPGDASICGRTKGGRPPRLSPDLLTHTHRKNKH